MRGKHGAQAAKRRAETAAETVDELRRTLNAERLAWKEERAVLLNEAQSLRGRLISEVNKLSAVRVREAEDATRAVSAEKEADFRGRSIALFKLFTRVNAAFKVETYIEIAETLGQQYGDLMYGGGLNGSRNERRMTNGGARKWNSLIKNLSANPEVGFTDKSERAGEGYIGEKLDAE